MNDGLIKLREHVRRDKPKALRKDFQFREPLRHGWMLPYLFPLETMAWGRWDYLAEAILNQQLPNRQIPQIEWSPEHGERSPGRQMFEKSLDCITRSGDWRGWSGWTYFDYFLDWLLYAFGDSRQTTLPTISAECEGASERLYQIFNLEPAIAYPHDYLGDILAENNFGRRSGFFPTPMEVAATMVKLQMEETGEDMRAKSVCDPALGTGRMLLAASNYSMNLYGNDVSLTVIKACLVNGYLYAPWMVRHPKFLTRQSEPAPTIEPNAQPPTTTEKQLELI